MVARKAPDRIKGGTIMSLLRWLFHVMIILAMVVFIASPVSSEPPARTNAPTSVPPNSAGGAVLPNLLIFFDNSGSMTMDVYTGTYVSEYTAKYMGVDRLHHVYTYPPLTRFDGLFDPTKRYTYVDGVNYNNSCYFEEQAGGEWSGNFLNWVTMGRVDIARLVLTGGNKVQMGGNYFTTNNPQALRFTGQDIVADKRWDDRAQVTDFNGVTAYQTPYSTSTEEYLAYRRANCDGDPSYTGLFCSFLDVVDPAGTTLQRYLVRIKKSADWNPTGVLHSLEGNANVGIMNIRKYHGGVIKKYVRQFSGTHFDDVINWLNVPVLWTSTDLETMLPTLFTEYMPNTSTYLSESLFMASRYFAQHKAFVETDSDCFLDGSAPYDSTKTPVPYELADVSNPWRDPMYDEDYESTIWCARNYICMITDGQPTWDTYVPLYVVDTDGNYVQPLVSLRDYDGDGADPCPCGVDLDYDCVEDDCDGSTDKYPFAQSGTYYLDDIAKYAFETDLRPEEGMPGTQNLTTHTIYIFEDTGLGEVLLSKTATKGGGRYFKANTASEFTAALENIFGEVGSAAQAASSVAVTSEPVAGADPMIFIPYYRHPSWYKWHGNIRAFTVGDDGTVRDASDNIATDSVDGDGVYDNAVWDAEVLLRDRIENGGTARTIFTYIPGTGQVDFTTANKATIGPNFDCDLNDNGTQDENGEVEALIDYIRGNDTPTGFSALRDRDGHYIGDIIHSSTFFVADPNAKFHLIYGDSSYGSFRTSVASRKEVLYAGANDGMLHCFDAETGEELWAYIPYNLLPHLKWLTDPSYGHVYYVDLTCRVWDINLGTAGSPDWRSILLGGLRLGGTPTQVDTDDDNTPETTFRSAIFALDVTDPEKPLPDAGDPGKDRNIILWEKNDDLYGYLTSMPIAVKVGDNWYVVFGAGAKDRDGNAEDQLGDAYTASGAMVFVLNPSDGSLAEDFEVKKNEWRANYFGSPVAIDWDKDYSVDAMYIGDAKGNVWRLKTYTESCGVKTYQPATNWSIDVDGGPDDDLAKPVLTLDPLFYRQPLHTKPSVTMDAQGRVWIFFGTGRYWCMNDNSYCGVGNECPPTEGPDTCTYTDINGETRSRFLAVGFYDRHWDGTGWALHQEMVHLDDLDERIIVSGPVAGNGSLTGYAIVDQEYPTATIETDVAADKKGWFFHLLEEGERALGEFRVYGGVVIFLSFNPFASASVDPCVYGVKTSNLYGVYYTSGTSTASPLWDLTREGIIDAGDLVVLTESGSSVGAGILRVEAGGFAGGSPIIKDNRAYLPLGRSEKFGQAALVGTGITSWKEEW